MAADPMTTEDFIRDAARRRWSKTQTREALGICAETFYAMLDAMPPLDWPAMGQSVGHRRANEARRGHCSPALRSACAKAVAARRALHLHEFNGVRGTIEELAAQASVSASTVRRRMKAGMSIGEALTKPLTPFALRRNGFGATKVNA